MNINESLPEFLSYKKASEVFGLERSTLCVWVHKQKVNSKGITIPYKRFGKRHVVFPRDLLREWLDGFPSK